MLKPAQPAENSSSIFQPTYSARDNPNTFIFPNPTTLAEQTNREYEKISGSLILVQHLLLTNNGYEDTFESKWEKSANILEARQEK